MPAIAIERRAGPPAGPGPTESRTNTYVSAAIAAKNGSPARNVIARTSAAISGSARLTAHQITSGTQAKLARLFETSRSDIVGPQNVMTAAPTRAASGDVTRANSRYAPHPRSRR